MNNSENFMILNEIERKTLKNPIKIKIKLFNK